MKFTSYCACMPMLAQEVQRYEETFPKVLVLTFWSIILITSSTAAATFTAPCKVATVASPGDYSNICARRVFFSELGGDGVVVLAKECH